MMNFTINKVAFSVTFIAAAIVAFYVRSPLREQAEKFNVTDNTIPVADGLRPHAYSNLVTAQAVDVPGASKDRSPKEKAEAARQALYHLHSRLLSEQKEPLDGFINLPSHLTSEQRKSLLKIAISGCEGELDNAKVIVREIYNTHAYDRNEFSKTTEKIVVSVEWVTYLEIHNERTPATIQMMCVNGEWLWDVRKNIDRQKK